ncbi:cytochrome c biogenesis protein ResB [Terribacillus saccharophilus]|uniref:cytochrome c biogenesis protein ResB n=2 Tax=Terribacillus saccharophilus TaxID=361277 RepID=UPI001140ED74|nr:cytochrome c biogenesis protein ResB [Terribacillus saccharophilus]
MQKCSICKHENNLFSEECHHCGSTLKGKLDMRYEGAGRRSQQRNQTLIDKVWRFFASVRNGMYILLMTLLATALGTILPQRTYIPIGRVPQEFYESEYGVFGRLYHYLGFDQLYSSWWYMTLLGLLGASILIASIDRFFPLYRALKLQPVKRKEHFLTHQLYVKNKEISDPERLIRQIRDRRYRVRQDGEDYLAEKNRFARWGPYVNHIGLLLVLLAAFLRLFSFFYQDEFVWIRDGETAVVPDTNQSLFIKNKQFSVDTYDADDPKFEAAIEQEGRSIPKSFTTDIIVYEAENHIAGDTPDLKVLKQMQVSVNHPVKAAGFTIYQSGYQMNEFSGLTLRAENEDGLTADFQVNTEDPQTDYELANGLHAKLVDYYPDYQLNGDNIITATKYPRNPAFVFDISEGDMTERLFIAIDEVVSETGSNKYNIHAVDYDTHNVTGLSVKRDWTLPVFLLGGLIFMMGLIQGLYWQHRRIWLQRQADGSYLIAGHTNKHASSFEREMDRILDIYDKGESG